MFTPKCFRLNKEQLLKALTSQNKSWKRYFLTPTPSNQWVNAIQMEKSVSPDILTSTVGNEFPSSRALIQCQYRKFKICDKGPTFFTIVFAIAQII